MDLHADRNPANRYDLTISMTRRYFASQLPPTGGVVTLSERESRHAIQVMRVQVGEPMTLFDGKGSEASATVCLINRNECQCETAAPRVVDREASLRLDLGIALPKPDRRQDLIERLTELGVNSITPLLAARSQRPPSEKRIEKLKRYVLEACKQCGRNRLMHIAPGESANRFLTQHSSVGQSTTPLRLIAQPGHQSLSVDSFQKYDHVIAAIGPEGGWTEDEVQLAVEQGFTPIDLGPRIYRIETAATLIAAVAALKI